MRRFGSVATLLLIFIMPISPALSDGGPWLPLKRADLIRLLALDTNVENVKVESFEQSLSALRSNPKSRPEEVRQLESQMEEESKTLASDESVWVAWNADIPLGIVMAGKDEDVHSLRVNLPVLAYSKDRLDRVISVLSSLFRSTYPTWPEAAEWPAKSLVEAWHAHPLTRQAPLDDPNDMIIKKRIDGVTSATFGVPVDLVVYTITARDECVPRIERGGASQQGDPLRRIIC